MRRIQSRDALRSHLRRLVAARQGDPAAFERLVSRHRRELYAHCYRMLGSVQDAEDCLQESLLGAWRGLASFQGRSSLRACLYHITTNACLRLISRRPRRILSPDYGPPWRNTTDLGNPVTGPIWLEPWQDDEPATEPSDVDPATQYLRRESVELAFVAAWQHLPGTQRAVLIMHDVLQFSSAEVARILDTTPSAVNSARQRPRKAVRERVPERTQQAELDALGTNGSRELVDAFMTAWERADVAALVDLLAKDARFAMPPLPTWFLGQADIGRFFADRMFTTPWRLLPLRANGQPGFAGYQGDYVGDRYRLAGINVLSVRSGRIAWIASFLDPDLRRHFGLPAELRPGDFRRER
jgi:RNA polymerase sigma-70 factor (TIGR02960 family)